MKTLVIIQARMASTRLPDKVMMPLAGAPLLARMIERVAAATTPFEFVIATTTHREDEPIRALCRENNFECFSGHPTDLLDRHYKAALAANADIVVKIPSDCPLIDPAVIDKVLGFYFQHRDAYDFVSNLHPATYPDGNDVEVMPFAVLETAWKEASRDFEREHTTPYIWEQPERFRIGNVKWETGLDYSMSHRWTIDYPEDYTLIKTVYDLLWRAHKPVFPLREILTLLEHEPHIAAINAQYAGVNWYRNHMGELKTVSADRTKQLT